MITLHEARPELSEALDLYNSVGWVAYTRDPSVLAGALAGTTLAFAAREEGALVGLIRAITDGYSLLYLQDILVRPSHQRRGVGRALVRAVLDRYPRVGQVVLLTDDEPGQHAFYRALGFHNTRELQRVAIHAFVQDRRFPLG